jgi:ribonuclease HI
MARKAPKFYVVWKGHHSGIFDSWDACKVQVQNVQGAQFKSFSSFEEAKDAFKRPYKASIGKNVKKLRELSEVERLKIGHPNMKSIAVDAAVKGNPGLMEYRGVETESKTVLFKQGPFQQGTNNIGEFLALVHGLAYLKKNNSDLLLYSDSRIAISWVKQKKCKTKLVQSSKNKEIFDLIQRATDWLKNNDYKTTIVKWETKAWGEIPADYGRK